MMGIYKEKNYYEGVQELRQNLWKVARSRAQLDYLDRSGVPDGSVVYSEPKKVYITKSGEECLYQYTNEILYIKGSRFYVKKKHPYPAVVPPSVANDPLNPDGHLALRDRLRLRMQCKGSLKAAAASAKESCKHVNANKSKDQKRISYAQALEEATADFRRSAEYEHVIGEMERQLGNEYGRIIETAADELRYCSFSNEIYSSSDERVRSKNELITAKCMQECGLSYEVEPFYPGTTKRADFVLHTGGTDIYMEILGRMDSEAYRQNFLEKKALAEKHRIPFVAVDMTDYPDASGRPVTRLYYDKLRRIMQKLSTGKLPGTIVRAY